MEGTSIEFVPTVRGGHLREAVQLKVLETVEDTTFFKLCKNDHVIQRLLLGKGTHSKRMLAHTDVVETIVELRNQKIHDIVEPPPVDDLGLDEPEAKRLKLKVLPDNVPKIVSIHAPTVGHVSGIDMKVMSGVARQPVYVELVASNIDYLAAVAMHQVEQGEIDKRKPKRDDCAVRVNYEERRQSWRARKPDGRQRYFADAKFEDAKAAAVQWVNDRQPIADDTILQPIEDM